MNKDQSNDSVNDVSTERYFNLVNKIQDLTEWSHAIQFKAAEIGLAKDASGFILVGGRLLEIQTSLKQIRRELENSKEELKRWENDYTFAKELQAWHEACDRSSLAIGNHDLLFKICGGQKNEEEKEESHNKLIVID